MLPKAHRLPYFDVKSVLKKGNHAYSPAMDLFSVVGNADILKLAVIISKKVDKRASKRNRTRRLVHQAFCALLPILAPGLYVIRIKKLLPNTQGEVSELCKKLFADAQFV